MPVRTCFACRSRKSGGLLRFTVRKTDDFLVLDGVKKGVGRGVYCCDNAACLSRFVKNKKGLKKALRVEMLDVGKVEDLL